MKILIAKFTGRSDSLNYGTVIKIRLTRKQAKLLTPPKDMRLSGITLDDEGEKP